jgi:hypothetical protein
MTALGHGQIANADASSRPAARYIVPHYRERRQRADIVGFRYWPAMPTHFAISPARDFTPTLAKMQVR